MASFVEIGNRALQKLGAKRIVSLTEDSRNARAINSALESVKLDVLRSHPWNCAIKRAQLAADVDAPVFTRARSFQLPSDCVRLLSPDPEVNFNDLDWQIEGRKILTNDSAPLNIRYIYNVTDSNEMDPSLREAIASKLAYELCEEITQSNTKKDEAMRAYNTVIREAQRINAFERVSQKPPEDEWITARS